MLESTSPFPKQLLSFFERYSGGSLKEALPLLENLYLQLLAGNASIEIDAPDNNSVKILRQNSIVGSENERTPLVMAQEGNLYFRRYFDYETSLAQRLVQWSKEAKNNHTEIDHQIIKYFKDAPDQLNAAKLALRNNFAVITGGPGTGKTYLLVAILASLLKENPELSISLLAPTGKAAQRMTESIQANLKLFELSPDEKENFPQNASTIHRLLRPLPPSIHFRKKSDSPLNADFVIVDEASMVDLPLMSKLVDAIRPTSRLLLIGDVDQLAPVEAGAPLASIVRHFLLPHQPQLVAKLSTNRRFGKDSSIHRLCQAISRGNANEVIELIDRGSTIDFEYNERTSSQEADQMIRLGYAGLAQAKTPAEAHQAFLHFQILCPTHEGECGVNSINERTQKLLGINQTIKNKSVRYSGMPIIIERNDYGVNLFNGDIGIFLADENQPDRLAAWFLQSDGTYRAISPTRLPPYKLAYAMTVHRSQGSEYDQVMIMLPSIHSELLTRHLLYVACSRARKKVILLGSKKVIKQSIKHSTPSPTGLQNRLIQA
jgi:exodeoxyribonuclease V alpha subunit